MKKLLAPKTHGYLDYALVLVFSLAPSLFDFSSVPAMLSYWVGGILLTTSLLTRYPLGIIKLIPFPVHGAFELVASVALILAPNLFAFGDQGTAAWFFRGVGISLMGVWAITDYKAASVANRKASPLVSRTV